MLNLSERPQPLYDAHIRNVIWGEIVLQNLRDAIQYVTQYETRFIQEAAECDMQDRGQEFVRQREELAKAEQRIAELDNIIKHQYEDNISGKLSDERFMRISHDYELEQDNQKSMADVLRNEVKQKEQQKTNIKAFVQTMKKYTDLQELDVSVLREFIDRIEISHPERNAKTRELTIAYNFIGAFDFARASEEAHNTSKEQQKGL